MQQVIQERCVGCGKRYYWNNSSCTWLGTTEVVAHAGRGAGGAGQRRDITMFVCPGCNSVVGVVVSDDNGEDAYTLCPYKE